MPVILHSNPSTHAHSSPANERSGNCLEPSDGSLAIGLINNMSDAALQATERQFISLLDSASAGIAIQLSLYSLPGIPRDPSGVRRSAGYSSVENLWDTQLDGLIVTGREPLTSHLRDEPYWETLTRIVDWAADNTGSTIWSCLAAHAAILHLDGIGRIKSDRKYCGVFECACVSDHPLTAGMPTRFQLPHSRWNGIPEEKLTACGYRVLTRSRDTGPDTFADTFVDTFAKRHNSLFVFFQGHPEYESKTLLLEYRRDVGRYLKGETNTYPGMPENYFDRDTVLALTALRQESIADPRTRSREELLAEVSRVLEQTPTQNTWAPTATAIYGNWLQYLCARKNLHRSIATEEPLALSIS